MMMLSFPIVVLGSQLFVAVADRPPNYDIARTCKLHLAAVGLDTGPQHKICMQSEQNARKTLQRLWLKFPAIERTDCSSWETMGIPSYVDLLACLQVPNYD
jgi:hypothetical protein